MLYAMARSEKAVTLESGDSSGFDHFITNIWVSLAGSDEGVNIKVLRNTGAKHSFIVDSVLPFSNDTLTGDSIVMHGMELGFVLVPRHHVVLDYDLVKGVFPVGVRSSLTFRWCGYDFGE